VVAVVEERVRTSAVSIVRWTCDGGRAEPEVEVGYELVVVRSGTYRRELEHGVFVVDPLSLYVARPGQWQHIHHRHGMPDTAYLVAFDACLVGDDAERLPVTPVRAAAVDLAVRQAVASADDLAVDETVTRLLGTLAGVVRGPPVTPSRRRAVERVRELLSSEVEAAAPASRLDALARAAGYAPHHLSRVFTAVTGTTIARYRRALRVRRAVHRLELGEHDLAAIAADSGFTDHSHLVRAMRDEYGMTPSQLRRLLVA
jgi:AraC-like DNA-binding protein